MSGRMNRVKDAIKATLEKVRAQALANRHPYLVGFANGLALADHHVNMRDGSPVMIEQFQVQRASPEPIDLDAEKYEELRDEVVENARALLKATRMENLGDREFATESATGELENAVLALEDFSAKLQEAGPGEAASAPDAGASDQVGATPAPASNSEAGFTAVELALAVSMIGCLAIFIYFVAALAHLIGKIG